MTYEYNGVRDERTAFASHPDGVIVIHLTANNPAACTGRVQLADMHRARIAADGQKLSSVGKLKNGFEYEAQLLVLNKNDALAVKNDDACAKNPWNIAVPATSLAFDQCDSVTLILGAGTNFLQDHTKQWLGAHPHAAVMKRVEVAARPSVAKPRARPVKDHPSLFRRFSLDVGAPAPDLLARTTLARLADYSKNRTADPNLEALFRQFGRYRLIACSRPGSLPANLQGVWSDSNEPAWCGDYHSNINLEMNDQEIIYDLLTNTIEAADVLGDDKEFRDRIAGLRDKLLKPKIGRWGQLQEWEADKDNPKDDHRHVSQLFALYPGHQITRAATPELAEAARVSLQARGDKSTGWRRAWKINFWARLWDGDHAHTMLRSLLNVVHETKTLYGESGGGGDPNLFDSPPPFQIDGNFGATAGDCETLGQSHTGRIHLLPALPKAWPTGKVTGLCARGGFEVEMSWEDGRLAKAVIHSKSGLPCRVVCGDKRWELNTKAGESYPRTLASKVDPRSVRSMGMHGQESIGSIIKQKNKMQSKGNIL